ncbi:MAG TPA: hypothetical protein PK640_21845 [Verrucomicrobiota bacterium]|nr:hypothetical protein [Verrucomicrobiota bacterium]
MHTAPPDENLEAAHRRIVDAFLDQLKQFGLGFRDNMITAEY